MRRTLTCLLAVGVLLLLGACGGTEAEDGEDPELVTATIATANGDVTVALDAHGQQTDTPITIEAITPVEGAQLAEDFVAAFRLLPAGATFDTPVTLSLTVVGPPEAALSGFHFSDDRPTELIEFLPVAYDPSADTTTYEAAVTHFSEVQVDNYGLQLETRILPAIPADQYFVGDSFIMRVRVVAQSLPSVDRGLYNGADSRVVSNRPPVLTFAAGWRTTGAPLGISFADAVSFTWITSDKTFAGSPLEPTEAAGPPQSQSVKDGQALTYAQEFTCISTGRFFVWFHGFQTQPGVATEYRGATAVSAEGVTRYGYANSVITGECVAPDRGTSTPTPGVALPTTGVAPSATALATGEAAIPTVVLPPDVVIATPAAPAGTGSDLPGFIRAYAYAGVFYYGETLSATPAHAGSCEYAHLHGGPILAVPVAGVSTPPLSEMYGACGFGPTSALFWIPAPE